MRPGGLIVAGPHGADALRSGVERAGKDERAAGGSGRFTGEESVVGCVVKGEAVEVVDVTMLPVSVVDVVLGHCRFGSVENRWFVHVIPDMHVWGGGGK